MRLLPLRNTRSTRPSCHCTWPSMKARSSSHARRPKRVAHRFERFKRVELDFAGVSEIGQAFADVAISRVRERSQLEIRITPINTEEAIAQMIRRVVSEGSSPQSTTPNS